MFKNILLTFAILLLLAITFTKLAAKYSWDITQNNSNTLAQSSKQLLDKIDDLVTISVYSPLLEIANTTESILAPFKKYSSQVKVEINNTVLEPKLAAKLRLYSEHNIVVTYKNAQQAFDIHVRELTEQQISTLIHQVMNQANHWLVFLTGHQEGNPLDTSELGLSAFAQQFSKQGMHVTTINLSEQKFIPKNTALLIVANPQQDFLPVEKAILHQYLVDGGKLAWFTEPDSHITAFMTEEFGVKPAKGVAIDPASLRMGSPHPALKILTKYPQHVITEEINSATLMPWSGHLQILFEANEWDQNVFLTTAKDTWTYNGPATKDLDVLSKYKEFTGPLNLGIALSKQTPAKQEQRALVIADSTFMTNKYLPLYANAQLASSIVAWTQKDTNLFIFTPPPLKDLSYNPSTFDRILYQYVFTMVIPLCLIGVGLLQSRRKTG